MNAEYTRKETRRSIALGFGLVGVLVLMILGVGVLKAKSHENNYYAPPPPIIVQPTPAVETLWTHTTNPAYGTSLMRMASVGDRVEIYYDHPRPSLRHLVRPGTLFFRGVWDGPVLRGLASVYKTDCPSAQYPVQGKIVSPGVLVLSGPAPVWDGCNIIGRTWQDHNANLLFYYVPN